MYTVELTYNRGSDNESTLYEDRPTLQSAVDWLIRFASGRTMVRAYINNVPVLARNGSVYTEEGEQLCTNPVWHELFAPEHIRILPAKVALRTPTNPATLMQLGKLEA